MVLLAGVAHGQPGDAVLPPPPVPGAGGADGPLVTPDAVDGAAADAPSLEELLQDEPSGFDDSTFGDDSLFQLASVPNMFGDFLETPSYLLGGSGYYFIDPSYQGSFPNGEMSESFPSYNPHNGSSSVEGVVLVPIGLAGGARRVKIAENNRAWLSDRVSFSYNHFHNAYDADANIMAAGPNNYQSVDRYTFGVEKVICDYLSVELRMPLTDDYGFNAGGFGLRGGDYGNFAVTLKSLLHYGPRGSLVAGVGLDAPTGSDVDLQFGNDVLAFENESFHVLPFLGMMWLPCDRVYTHGFFQIDVPTNGNSVHAYNGRNGQWYDAGVLDDQTLMFIDLGMGYWLYQNPGNRGVTGLALVSEFHYTTTLNDADILAGTVNGTSFVGGNIFNRIDIANVTVGLDVQIFDLTNFGIAGVFPLNDGPNRAFDAEVVARINRFF